AALLAAAVPRLAELDAAAVEAAAVGGDGAPRQRFVRVLTDSLHGEGYRRTLARYELVLEAARRPEIHRAMAAGTEHVLEDLTDPLPGEGYRRSLARYEMVLAAGRRPEIRRAMAAGTEHVLEHLTALFPSLPAEDARLRARDVLAFVDGLLLANVTSPEEQRQ